MTDRAQDRPQTGTAAGALRRFAGSAWVEALMVALAGAVLAYAANALSPRGLSLTRKYPPKADPGPRTVAMSNGAATNRPAAELLAARIQQRGFKPVNVAKAAELYRDPRAQLELVLFLDARGDELFEAGHIPGAYVFDPYRPEKYYDTVLPACHIAEEIVLYCNGGTCEDSEFAAVALRELGIAPEKLLIVVEGFSGWSTNGLPVEKGKRNPGGVRPWQP